MVKATPQTLEPKERHGTYSAGGWVGSRAGLGRGRKVSPLPRFDPRTVHPVARHYTDCPIYIYFLFIYKQILITPLLKPGGQKAMRKC